MFLKYLGEERGQPDNNIVLQENFRICSKAITGRKTLENSKLLRVDHDRSVALIPTSELSRSLSTEGRALTSS